MSELQANSSPHVGRLGRQLPSLHWNAVCALQKKDSSLQISLSSLRSPQSSVASQATRKGTQFPFSHIKDWEGPETSSCCLFQHHRRWYFEKQPAISDVFKIVEAVVGRAADPRQRNASTGVVPQNRGCRDSVCSLRRSSRHNHRLCHTFFLEECNSCCCTWTAQTGTL